MNQTKSSPLKAKMQSFLWSCLLLFGIATMINGCKDKDTQQGAPTTETSTEEKPLAPPPPNANFFQLKIDSPTFVRTFYLTPPADGFKKLLLNFTVNNYSDRFPKSLTLLAQGAKQNDHLHDPAYPSVLLQIKDTTTVSLPTDVLFTTLELSFHKLSGMVGRDGRGRRYKEVIFIPFVKDSCGKKYLSYRARCWPPLGGGADPEEELNPCPPQKPNHN